MRRGVGGVGLFLKRGMRDAELLGRFGTRGFSGCAILDIGCWIGQLYSGRGAYG